MLGLPATAWVRFGVWMLIGGTLYVAYGRHHSRLAADSAAAPAAKTP
jgi:APA family basic amino acid/polyamine antiporter